MFRIITAFAVVTLAMVLSMSAGCAPLCGLGHKGEKSDGTALDRDLS